MFSPTGGDAAAFGTLMAWTVRALVWVPMRFLAAARADLRSGRLSAATVGFGIPIVWLVMTAVVGLLPARPIEDAWAILGGLSLGLLLAYPPLHLADALRAREGASWWLLVMGGIALLDVLFAAGAVNGPAATDVAASTALVLVIMVMQAGAFLWGLAGRPWSRQQSPRPILATRPSPTERPLGLRRGRRRKR